MSRRILHILSQRPSRTGSGVTLDAMVRLAADAGWRQAAVVGAPLGEENLEVGNLAAEHIHPVWFARDLNTGTRGCEIAGYPDLDMPIPGMSDVMPYTSSIWSNLTEDQLQSYRKIWRRHLSQIIADFAPDIIHCHHIWLVSSLLKAIAPQIPVIVTCHSTGLRQMVLTPNLADEVKAGCSNLDHFCVLREDHRHLLQASLAIPPQRITVIGAGYRRDLFQPPQKDDRDPNSILYVGKLSRAKGLPWLLTAFGQLWQNDPALKFHIAGSGAGPEADEIRRECQTMSPQVVMHGAIEQKKLAALMGRCAVCVLPSFYEGVPLVLVEAAACGCQIVATKLPGVCEQIAPRLGPILNLVALPRLHDIDQPEAADLPAFVNNLMHASKAALKRAASKPPVPASISEVFSWETVFQRVQSVWDQALGS